MKHSPNLPTSTHQYTSVHISTHQYTSVHISTHFQNSKALHALLRSALVLVLLGFGLVAGGLLAPGAGLLPTAQAQALAVPNVGNWWRCTNYCATGNCATSTLTITVPTTGNAAITNIVWQAVGGVQLITATPNTGPVTGSNFTSYSVTYRSLPGNYCKGRIFFKWSEGTCTGYQVQVDIFKTFIVADMGATFTALYPGQTLAGISGPTCVSPGAEITLSIHPFITSCVNADIGQDKYQWGLPANWTIKYYSGDSSSVVLKVPEGVLLAGSCTVTVAVGTKCNGSLPNGNRLSIVMNRAPSKIYLTGAGSGINQWNAGNNITQANACLYPNLNSDITLGVNPDEDLLFDYEWQPLPPGWSFVSGDKNTRLITVTGGLPGAAGTFTCRTGIKNMLTNTFTDACGLNQASYSINRPALSTYQTLSLSKSCVEIGVDASVTATINPNSTNQEYDWSYSPTVGYTNVTAANPIIIPINSNSVNTTLSVTGKNSAGCTTATAPATLTLTAPLRIRDGSQITNVSISQSGRTLSFLPTGWNPSSCSNGGDFSYQWTFVGRYTPTNGPVVTASTPLPAGLITIIPPFDQFDNSQTMSIKPGNYTGPLGTGSATFACTITSRGTCAALCFKRNITIPVTGAVLMPPPGGGSTTRMDKGDDGKANVATGSMLLVPNPASSTVQIKFAAVPAEGSTLQITNAEGKMVHSGPATKAVLLNVKTWPKGLYTVRCGTEQQNLVVE